MIVRNLSCDRVALGKFKRKFEITNSQDEKDFDISHKYNIKTQEVGGYRLKKSNIVYIHM